MPNARQESSSQELSLCELNYFPEALRDVPAVLIQQVLPGPTLIHLPGQASEPIFVSILLHGDEDVGLKAIQKVITHYTGQQLPRALSILVGNVEAATAGVRYLPHQLDYNRVWPHAEQTGTLPEHLLMREVVTRMSQRQVCASIDLHNNSGRNPHYSCVCSLDPQHSRLASLFGPRVMYFTRPKGVQTAAFAPLCPAITCECGPIGDGSGVLAAADLLLRLMGLGSGAMDGLLPPLTNQVQLYRTIGTWRILPQATLSFNSRTESTVFLRPDLDSLNFQLLAAGTALGESSAPLSHCMEVRDESGRDVTQSFLRQGADGTVSLSRAVIPSMLTTSPAAIRQDCVGYLMESMPAQSAS